MMESGKFYSPNQLAELMSVSVRTIWRWVERGWLPPPGKLGHMSRWNAEDLDHLRQQIRSSRTKKKKI